MGGKSKAQTVGYHYRPAFHVGLVGRMIDAFLEYRAADKTAWAGELTASGRIQIDAPDLFGGEKDQGGIVGPVDVMFGEPDQVPNPYLVEAFGPQTAAWRGMTTLVFAGGRFGAMNPYQQKSAYKIRKILNGWDGETWYPERAAIAIQAGPAVVVAPDIALNALDAAKTPENGVTVDNIEGGSVVIVELPLGLTYTGWSLWSGDNVPGSDGRAWWSRLEVTGGDHHWSFFHGMYATGLEAVVAAQPSLPIRLSGHRSYTFWLWDDLPEDNRGGLSVRVSVAPGLTAMNPAHILYYLRTDSEKGGEPRENINEESLTAAADRLFNEGFGLCQVVYDPQQDTPDSMTERICRIIGGSFERSLIDGQWYLDLARGDYDVESLPVMNDDDILEFKKQPTTLHGVTNSLSVRYFDPQRKESIITPAVRALGLVQTFGEIHETLDFPEIPDGELALRVADRELRARITPSEAIEVVTRPRAGLLSLRRSQYFRLQSAKRGIADMVCIVGEKDIGTLRSGAIRWKVAQDIYGLPDTTYVEVEEGVDVSPPQQAVPIEHGVAFEAPYIDVVASLPRAELEALPDDVGYLLGAAARPAHGLDYTMVVRPDGGEFAPVATGEWGATATTTVAVPRGNEPVVVQLGTVRGLDRVPLGSPVLMGNEILRLDAVELDPPEVTLARGCADTVPWPHTEGARIWFLAGEVAVDITEYTEGESVEVRFLANTGSHQLPLDYAPTLALTFVGRQARPYPPGRLRISDDLAEDQAYPESCMGELRVFWAHRDRVLQADQLIDTDAAGIGPEPATTYTVRYYLGDVLSHTESDIAGEEAPPVLLPANGVVRIEVVAVRGGLTSWQAATVQFFYQSSPGDPYVDQEGIEYADQNENSYEG